MFNLIFYFMASKSLFSMFNLNNKVSRNGFDLSKRVLFSAKVGELLPVAFYETLPGDSFKIKTSSFTRTVPCQTSAFTRINEYYDWFFVPYRLLYRNFNSNVTLLQGKNSVQATSNISSSPAQSTIPYTTLSDLASAVNAFSAKTNIFGFDVVNTSCKLLSYLGYGDLLSSISTSDNVSTLGKFYKFDRNVSMLPLAAYQKIYTDFFRLDQWENASPWRYNFDYLSNSLDPKYTFPSGSSMDYITSHILSLQYCNYPKDMIFGVLPNSQFGDVATINLSNNLNYTDTLHGALKSHMVYDDKGNLVQVGDQLDTQTSSTPQYSIKSNLGGEMSGYLHLNSDALVTVPISIQKEFNNSFDVLQLRKAQALQRWNEISQSGSTDFKEQIKKHWNIDVSDFLSDKCTYIGSSKGSIVINEVVNTSLQSSDDVADIKGKGVGSSEDFCEFNCQEYGLIMCIYHAIPDVDYQLNRQDFSVSRVAYTDFAIPEFDKLGLQPFQFVDFINDASVNENYGTSILGYSPRYFDYKTSIDEVKGVFVTSRPDWVACYDSSFIRYNTKAPFKVDWSFFKVDPRLLDSIFGVAVDSSVNTDTMYISCDISCHVVRNLDFDGMPF